MRRVAVTGMGVVTPVGLDVASFWAFLLKGVSGVSRLELFDTSKLRSDVVALVRDFDAAKVMGPRDAEMFGRVTSFSVAAADEAMEMAGFPKVEQKPKTLVSGESSEQVATTGEEEAPATDGLGHRAGCLMSTGMGAVEIFENTVEKSLNRGPRVVSPFFIPAVMPNAAAAMISMRYGLMGPSYSIASACATGTHAIATAAMMIQSGDADVMLTGGAEAAVRINTVAGFGNARALARVGDGDPRGASRPFDSGRNGFVIGEGAGALVLEEETHARKRGANILGYVLGYGMSTDATHVARPHASGLGLALAMEQALHRAGLKPADIGYINPHATSTVQGDVAEYRALCRVFGDGLSAIPISATKSIVGHLLGGAGAIESIACLCTLRDQMVHPSINVDKLDELFHIDLVREARASQVRYAIKNSAGFGGHNCSLVFGLN